MQHTFVGDIHGKVEVVRQALEMPGRKHFVGDLQDSYDRSPEEHHECFRLVLDAIERGEADCVYGNHELSYMRPGHRCSGYDTRRGAIMRGLDERITALFRPYVLVAPDLLVTHAGLSNRIWKDAGRPLEDVGKVLDEWWNTSGTPMDWIGRIRGGYNYTGGPFWCHYPEEFHPIPGLRQVFGHTRLRGGIDQRFPGNWAIDCLDFKHPGEGFLVLDLP